MSKQNIKKDKYQWANYIRSLDVNSLKSLINSLEGLIELELGIGDSVRTKVMLEFAKKVLNGD